MKDLFKELCDFIKNNNINAYRISCVCGDEAPRVYEFCPCNPCQNSYSVAKSFVITALGLAYDKGLVRTDEYITDILAPYIPKDTNEKWKNITIDMALRHHCGLPAGFLDIDCNNINNFGKDFLAHVMTAPLADPDVFSYSDAAYYVLARVVCAKVQKPLIEFLWDNLFWDLGFQEVAWSCCPFGYVMGATGLYIRTEDLAKLGALYYGRGIYQGKRILSEEWINIVNKRAYLPWCLPDKAYGHGGMRGQMLLILPEKKTAFAWHGYDCESDKIINWINENY